MTSKGEAEAGAIAHLGVCCDRCAATASADFKVRQSDSREVRLGYVRTWAAEELGWSVQPGLDLCAGCLN